MVAKLDCQLNLTERKKKPIRYKLNTITKWCSCFYFKVTVDARTVNVTDAG